jgi:LPS-assembly protein
MRFNITVNALILLIIGLLLPVFVHAQEDDLNISRNIPVQFQADSLYQDKANDLIYGQGHVFMEQGNQMVIADQIVYHRKEDIIYAKGNVAFKKEDGSIIYANEAKFYRGISQGVALDFRGRFGKKGLLAAKSAEMKDSMHMQLNDFVYSPCKICEDNLFRYTPLWEIHSQSAELDKESERISYRNATVDLFGVPVAYTPYFTTPSPGAKRKGGLLLPRYDHDGLLGQTVTIPLYLNIAPNMDATYYPRITQKSGILHQGEFRHLSKYGKVILKGSYANSRIYLNGIHKHEDVGHYDVAGEYSFKEKGLPGYFEFESKRIHNKEKTFLKKFKISDEDILRTDVKYNYFTHTNYLGLRSLFFQDLREGYNAKTTSAALPVLDAHLEYKTRFAGAKLYTDLNVLNLKRPQGTNYERYTVKPGANLPYLLPYGHFVTFDLSARMDAYDITKKPITVSTKNTIANLGKSGRESRVYPEFTTEWSWPLYNSIWSNSIILEPVVDLIYGPRMTNLQKLTNEDSLDPEITAGNLFTTNRYKGYDKIESGPRMNYGIRGNISNQYIQNINFIFGQSRRRFKDVNFDRISGMDGMQSDYVGKLALQLTKHLTIIDNFRLHKKSAKLLRNLTTVEFAYSKVSAGLTYAQTDESLISPDKNIFTQEYLANMAYNFYREWSISGHVHGRFGKKPPTEKTPLISDGVMLQYAGDCLIMRLSVSRDYTKLRDLKPSTTFSTSFEIPVF